MSAVPGSPTQHCACGHELQAFGRGRHRIYFEAFDTGLSNPVMDHACPSCHQALADRPRVATRSIADRR